MKERKLSLDFSVTDTDLFNMFLNEFKQFLSDDRIDKEIREEHYQNCLQKLEEAKINLDLLEK